MGAAIKRIKMRVLGILLIISLGCLSALDVESGRFEDEHFGVNEITKVPKTEVAEVVLPQTSLKADTTSEKLLGKKTGKMSGKTKKFGSDKEVVSDERSRVSQRSQALQRS